MVFLKTLKNYHSSTPLTWVVPVVVVLHNFLGFWPSSQLAERGLFIFSLSQIIAKWYNTGILIGGQWPWPLGHQFISRQANDRFSLKIIYNSWSFVPWLLSSCSKFFWHFCLLMTIPTDIGQSSIKFCRISINHVTRCILDWSHIFLLMLIIYNSCASTIVVVRVANTQTIYHGYFQLIYWYQRC